jgi:hypothetical protein
MQNPHRFLLGGPVGAETIRHQTATQLCRKCERPIAWATHALEIEITDESFATVLLASGNEVLLAAAAIDSLSKAGVVLPLRPLERNLGTFQQVEAHAVVHALESGVEREACCGVVRRISLAPLVIHREHSTEPVVALAENLRILLFRADVAQALSLLEPRLVLERVETSAAGA